MSERPLLELDDVRQTYKPKRSAIFGGPTGLVKAVDGVTLQIHPGETVGLVGESGCGKSTLARIMVGLEAPAGGRVLFEGRDLGAFSRKDKIGFHRNVQLIFQDPAASLDPRKPIGVSIAEGIVAHALMPRAAMPTRVQELLREVGLDPTHVDRYPHQFSGGQLQRVGIARALAVNPQVLVCDEPVSALDISVRAQVLNLLNRLKRTHGLAIVFIAHDLDVVQHMSDRILTMYLGRIVEEGPCEAVYHSSAHPYTRALLSAVPRTLAAGERIDRVILEGDPPSPIDPPPGCPFHTRCYAAISECSTVVPALELVNPAANHRAACLLREQITTSTVGMPYQLT